MLTGWDLSHPRHYEKIQEVGAWINHWSYDPNNPVNGVTNFLLLCPAMRSRRDTKSQYWD